MPPSTRLTIRPATIAASDHEFFIDIRDSQLAWLSSVGSTDQWGTTPVREAYASMSERTRSWIERSEQQAPWGGEDWCRAFVAEAPSGTPIAALVLEAKAAAYTHPVLPEQQDASDPFVYLTYVITNGNAREESKGAGAAMIALAKEETRKTGVKRLCVDCYRGNDRKLVKYYESQGFMALGDFTAPKPGTEGWPGCVLEMRL